MKYDTIEDGESTLSGQSFDDDAAQLQQRRRHGHHRLVSSAPCLEAKGIFFGKNVAINSSEPYPFETCSPRKKMDLIDIKINTFIAEFKLSISSCHTNDINKLWIIILYNWINYTIHYLVKYLNTSVLLPR